MCHRMVSHCMCVVVRLLIRCWVLMIWCWVLMFMLMFMLELVRVLEIVVLCVLCVQSMLRVVPLLERHLVSAPRIGRRLVVRRGPRGRLGWGCKIAAGSTRRRMRRGREEGSGCGGWQVLWRRKESWDIPRCPCARQTRRLRRLVILGACVHGGRFRCSDVCRLVSLLVPPGFVCGVQHMHEVEGVGGSGDGL